MKNNKKGFTLVELLVVIAIIGLLSTLAVVALNNARQKARDARRVSDVKQIQTALELYYNDEGGYPNTVVTGSAITGATSLVTYMNAVPGNPTPTTDGTLCGGATGDYTYTMQNTNASYTLDYCLGASTGGIDAGLHKATPAGIQ
ncbi:prepilin-type N-terminal cleavage/methylation domain-containing protein [Patescibacteria group bacterium]|nr:prepilin-type N-terminal cleavage/methylation domain-containing protein [Patescibacteria group bacterium]MBU4455217.1 prepilin-type N-terminal cleavage/methylation domain-containing protein [Patescibacteria group bacterium]MCG2690934.1 prepilin-type N-terminal cleavage/methylation domain-containing protein [Candidatus Parcubacteria bacterium]